MSAKITSRQKQQAQKVVGDALTSLNPSKDGAQRVLGNKGFHMRFKQLFTELSGEYYNPLSDKEAIPWIVKHANRSKSEARQIVEFRRVEAQMRGFSDDVDIQFEVQSGCRFKRDISKMGPTRDDFTYLQDWDFPDPPTEHALVSWFPVPLADSVNKNVSEQMAMINTFKTEADLPDWYEVSFGSVNHVAGLALAHFKETGKDPFTNLWVRTDTCCAGGDRLKLCWGQGRLDCGRWGWDVHRNSGLAVFVVGVIKGLGR